MHINVYLVQNRLASQEQVQEAIDYRQTHGGRLETHLFRFGYVNESGLVAALARQYGCPGICLSGLDISETTLDLLSAEAVLNHLAIPFHYDSSTGIVKIACEDPDQPALRENLAQLMPGKTVELHIALGTTLRLAILKHYRQTLLSPSEAERDWVAETIQPPLDIGLVIDPVGTVAEPESKSGEECRLLLLDMAKNEVPTLGQVLQYQAYLVTVAHTIDDFVESASKYKPHIAILQVPGDRSAIHAILDQLTKSDYSIVDHATFLIIDDPEKPEVSDLLRAGFEDIISSDNVLDLMMIKLRRTRDRIFREHSQRHEILRHLGTHGSLDDMNVIDLLQTMGQTRKTARLSVSGQGRQLTIYLKEGQIIYADCDDLVGAEAVYYTLGWRRGVWSLEPVAPENLPCPNVSQTNEGILLEGCRRLDEGVRDMSSVPVNDALSALGQFS